MHVSENQKYIKMCGNVSNWKYQTVMSTFHKYWFYIWKIINNALYLKKKLIFRTKNGICLMCTCTKIYEDILKNFRTMISWRSKIDNPSSRYFSGYLYFTDLQILPIWAVQKYVLGSVFAFLTKKFAEKHTSHVPNPKFSIWYFHRLKTLNDIDLKYAHWRLRTVLRSVPDMIHIGSLTYLHFMRL